MAWLVISPWGDYPLNDDWSYAHVAKHTAETNVLKNDVPMAPNGVGQVLLGALLIKIFGFSYTMLRIVSFFVGALGLLIIDRLLTYAAVSKSLRRMTLLLLAFNPIYFYSSSTFMNELYGWIPAFLAVLLWFWDRARLAQNEDRIVSPWVPFVVGALAGSTFWTRQFAVLVYPALLAATLIRFGIRGRWRAILASAPWLGLGAVVCGSIVWAFFPWAKASGNFHPEFAERIDNLWKFQALTYEMQTGSALVYLTAFFLPLLVISTWPRGRWRWLVNLAAIGLVAVAFMAKILFEKHAGTDFWIGPIWSHKVFPFIVNIVYNAGIGPLTFDDTFFYDVPKASWRKEVWLVLEFIFIVGAALWSPIFASLVDRVRQKSWNVEIPLFGAVLAGGSLFAIIQAHQDEMVDRYYVELILGMIVLVPSMLTIAPAPGSRRQWPKFALLWVPLACFTVAGVHDQFRWNDARWKLVRLAMAQGATRATVQGGYEVNCWYRAEGLTKEETSCEGGCRCTSRSFCCVDDRFRIGLTVGAGYRVIASEMPSYWLASGPPVILSHR